jgi:hypothetical protein
MMMRNTLPPLRSNDLLDFAVGYEGYRRERRQSKTAAITNKSIGPNSAILSSDFETANIKSVCEFAAVANSIRDKTGDSTKKSGRASTRTIESNRAGTILRRIVFGI